MADRALKALSPNLDRMSLLFEVWRNAEKGEELVAWGEQQIACMRRTEAGLVPTPVPETLREALRTYAEA